MKIAREGRMEMLQMKGKGMTLSIDLVASRIHYASHTLVPKTTS